MCLARRYFGLFPNHIPQLPSYDYLESMKGRYPVSKISIDGKRFVLKQYNRKKMLSLIRTEYNIIKTLSKSKNGKIQRHYPQDVHLYQHNTYELNTYPIYYLMYQWIPGKDGFYLQEDIINHNSEVRLRWFIRTITKIMINLSLHNYVHLDLKPENLIFNNICKPELTIIDFETVSNIAHPNDRKLRQLTRPVGTEFYMAPEVKYGKYNCTTDVYSLGKLFNTCCVYMDVSDDANDLRNKMLHPNPNYRILFKDILRHKWFSSNDFLSNDSSNNSSNDFI